jgi:hypothetical protein
MSGSGSGKTPAVSGDNVKVCVRVRPISSGDAAFVIPPDGTPGQLQLFDVKGKLATTYGVGE